MEQKLNRFELIKKILCEIADANYKDIAEAEVSYEENTDKYDKASISLKLTYVTSVDELLKKMFLSVAELSDGISFVKSEGDSKLTISFTVMKDKNK